MKKKFKKLSLTTETLRNLSGSDLQQAAGAASEQPTVCTRDCTVCTGTCTACTGACTGCTQGCSICCM
ncbi:MAG TPA: hypothetical protein VLT87_30925 [Thermoanaerobaculia bacterium]|nr:hypothetical protein [Thermoanaerobaculia bacterium]